MKKLSALLGFVVLALTELVFANAVATNVTGNVTVQTGSAAGRQVRLGDEVRQGDTVVTGAGSSLVLKFDDGLVAALTANSRMTITNYQYNPQARTGNILLSLVNGGMRAVTGLIGRNSPQNVSYRAASATIGIRGTDVIIGTDGGNVVVKVVEGAISFTFQGKTINVPAGQGVNANANGTFNTGAADAIAKQAPQSVLDAVGGVEKLSALISQAQPGQPRSGTDSQLQSGTSVISTPSTGTTTGSGSGGGTGSPSRP
jgi:hypothetical protein